MNYFVYIVECADGTYYTGITTDVDRRIKEHNESPLAAKYTRVRRPVILKYSEECLTRSEALKREYKIKRLDRFHKKVLIERSK